MEDERIAVLPCRFRWFVHNPFLPFGQVEVSFNQSHTSLTEWKVALSPARLNVREWRLTFSLTAVRSREEAFVILANRVVVNISLSGESLVRRVENEGYSFNADNEHTFRIENLAIEPGQCHLDCRIEIHFPDEVVEVANHGLNYPYENLKRLKKDLRQLFVRGSYSDIQLLANDLTVNFVHTYILEFRWDNFFKLHDRLNSVETNISFSLLYDILKYVYYADGFSTCFIPRGNEENTRELFQVMSKYDLDHLYVYFFTETPEQVRRTIFPSCTIELKFEVDENDGERYYSYTPFPRTSLTIIVEFRLSDPDDPHFTYLLRIPSIPMVLHARVIVILKGVSVSDEIVHQVDYSFHTKKEFKLNKVFFGEWRQWFTHRRKAGESRPSIHFFVSISNGMKSVYISRESVPQPFVRINQTHTRMLSEHMRRLMLHRDEGNMQVACPSPGDPPNPPQIHHFHDGIFVSRIPEWRNVVQDPESLDISRRVTCILSSRAFELMTEYFYTGKCPIIPTVYFREISEFAMRGGLNSLAETFDFFDRKFHSLVFPSGEWRPHSD
ncbi:unnamed protein product [Larinioides sclopetarius]|uniref:Galectin n=1 Tax=Larinioides sclopetarius TaxID=280406 RepID=A0AAV2BV01_9ARAC